MNPKKVNIESHPLQEVTVNVVDVFEALPYATKYRHAAKTTDEATATQYTNITRVAMLFGSLQRAEAPTPHTRNSIP